LNLTEFGSLCFERWLGRDHGGAAEVWLAQQAAYDLWQARQTFKATKPLTGVKVLKFHPV
jgi:plasmid maintenance system antidote protein VapI